MVENFDGYRLTQGRHLLGVRREELAVRCFVTPRRVLAWENEHAEPTEEELGLIMDTLQLPRVFFTKTSETTRHTTGPLFMSGGGNMGWAHDEDRIAAAYAHLVHETITVINKRTPLPEVTLPCIPTDPTAKHGNMPEFAAEQTREHWGIELGAPIRNLTQHIERDGVTLVYAPKTITVGTYSLQTEHPIIIADSWVRDHYRQRLKTGEHLGHLIMHFDGDPRSKEATRDAQRYATALLTPDEAYDTIPRRRSRDTLMMLKDFKEQWGVPMQFTIEQLRRLKIWSGSVCDDMLNTLKQQRWWVSEPGERKHELEPATTLPDAVHKTLDTYPLGMLIEDTRLPDWLFKTITAPLPQWSTKP